MPCLVTQELDYEAKSGAAEREDERIIKNVAATTYAGRSSALVSRWSNADTCAGGSDTVVSAMRSFFLAMASHTDVQKKAQDDLDRVCAGRLPLFADRPELPYIVRRMILITTSLRRLIKFIRTASATRFATKAACITDPDPLRSFFAGSL